MQKKATIQQIGYNRILATIILSNLLIITKIASISFAYSR